MRLDKFLANMTLYSRKDSKNILREGRVMVNGNMKKSPKTKINPNRDHITLDGEIIPYRPFVYYLLNKPQGVISSTKAEIDPLVTQFLPDEIIQIYAPFPVGRLDKDTEGLLLLTNDGEFTHRALSPKYGIKKVYEAVITGQMTEKDAEKFQAGIILEDGEACLPADLKFLGHQSEKKDRVQITIQEGKFHQIKRMCQAINKPVLNLRRISMGTLDLPKDLQLGEVRELTQSFVYEKVLGE